MVAHGPISTVILCGGRGTRIRDAGPPIPKPMVTIGSQPILWHIMKIYAAHGFTDFVLALGYLAPVIKEFFLHYEALTSDFTLELGRPESMAYLRRPAELGWRISCIDTGLDAQTGSRVRDAARDLPDGPVMVTYGDGVGNVDIQALMDFHRAHGRLATLTTVRPPGRFGELRLDGENRVLAFEEKPQISSGAINGGFMVFEKEAIDHYIPPDEDMMIEREPLTRMVKDGQVMAFEHDGFWQPVDTLRERDLLIDLWERGEAPWKIWD